ncbi:aldo/keto reductase [Cohnella soli]|uniref:Aldo/keto reductase n=1 Tax=Cohnella soli TaxID=425005 RepID=A0ABW0HWU5_9BACL
MKLGLGTVQFGMPYGVSNRTGQTMPDEAAYILDVAAAAGVQVLDTAALYGESERVLGRLLRKSHPFRIVTKTDSLIPPNGASLDADEVVRRLEQSLRRLGQSNVYGFLLHRPAELLSPYGETIMRGLEKCKRMGYVAKVGVSVYPEDSVFEMIAKYPLDLVQVPVNLLDQRLIANGFLDRCKEQGIEIHARSVFLQGLIGMEPNQMPAYFAPYMPKLSELRDTLDREGIGPMEAAVSFAEQCRLIDAYVCGVNDGAQLSQLIAWAVRSKPRLDYTAFAATEPGLLNPALWKIS